MSVLVLKPGALTTVQDGGRQGFRQLGVGLGGAVDAFSARVANLLVGNGDEAALLEITLAGPTLRFENAQRIALTGARMDARCGDVTLPGWRWIDVPAGAELHLGGCRDGARAYLAIAGGIDVPSSMGSRATDVRAGFGGFDGRALRAGDRLPIAGNGPFDIDAIAISKRWIDPLPDLDLAHPALAHAMPGADALAAPSTLFAAAWRVTAASDRQGLRLAGPPLALADARERLSSPVAPGTVQLPPDGQPIVLLGEAQTVGGYPVIAHVATADLPRLAQCRPGDDVRFTPITRDEAIAKLHAQLARLERLRLALR